MAGDTQLRNIILLLAGAGSNNFFQGSAMGIMAGGAVHAALIMRTYFPILPAKACVAVTASTQISGTVYRHGSFWVISGCGSMTGFACHAIRFIGGCGWIETCRVTYEASAGLTLLIPLIQEDWITAGFSVRAVFPGHLKFGMTNSTILGCSRPSGRHFSLCAGHDQCYPCGKQGEHQGNQQTFNTRGHFYILLGSIFSAGMGASMKTSQEIHSSHR